MSEENIDTFNFGTRFPYIIKPQTEDWVKILDERDTVDATKIYMYGTNTISESDFDDNELFQVDAEGNDSKSFPIKRILSGTKYPATTQVGWRYSYEDNNGKTNYRYGHCNRAGKSKSSEDIWTATDGKSNNVGIATARSMVFFKITDNVTLSNNEISKDFDTAIKNAIIGLIKFDGDNTPSINVESEGISAKEIKPENLRKNGEGKYLDLRVLYGHSVNQILNILSKNRKRKDLLFYKAESWKNKPSENSDPNISKAASLFNDDIHEDVKLIPENFVFRSGIKYDLGLSSEVTNSGPFKAINNLAGGGAMLDAIIKAAKGKEGIGDFTFSERVDRFRNVPYVKDVDNSCIDSLTFKFQFGQFGLFSCEKEVVLPILKLASLFSYSFTGYDFSSESDEKNWIKAPFEPKFNVMSKMYTSLFNSGRPLISNLLGENKDESGKTIEKKPGINSLSQVPKLFSSIVNEAAGQARVTAFLFSIGSSIYGPFFASDVKWEFDYERTDSKGLPFAGTISFSGIKPLLVEDNIGLLSTGGQIIGDYNG
jgi:hypothetical protein